jgi:tetratricopeptide (TPR) repeat protein
MSKTCFVISPIGEDGSQTRQHADDLYDLVLKVALEPFQFEVVRADKLPGSGQITTEIIELVQRSELCVIDLTGHNANVYYECGRRHETGKPFVQLLRKGDRLPFDLAGIRTIMYSLETPRAVFDAVNELRRYTSEFDRAGYGPAQSGTSMSTLASALERLERKVDKLTAAAPTNRGSATGGMSIEQLFENPRAALAEALATGQIDTAIGALRRVYELIGPSTELLTPAAVLAQAGSEQGLVVLEEILTTRASDLDIEELKTGMSGWVRFFVLTDRELEARERAARLAAHLTEGRTFSNKDEAFIRNQLQILHYGARDYVAALEESNRTLELVPDVGSYWYNNSLIHEKLNQFDLAERAVDRCLECEPETRDDDHLAQAIEIYVARGRVEEAKRLYARLQDVSSSRAALLILDTRIRTMIIDEQQR